MRQLFFFLILFILLVSEGVAIDLLPNILTSKSTLIVPHWIFVFLFLIVFFYVLQDTFFLFVFFVVFFLFSCLFLFYVIFFFCDWIWCCFCAVYICRICRRIMCVYVCLSINLIHYAIVKRNVANKYIYYHTDDSYRNNYD